MAWQTQRMEHVSDTARHVCDVPVVSEQSGLVLAPPKKRRLNSLHVSALISLAMTAVLGAATGLQMKRHLGSCQAMARSERLAQHSKALDIDYMDISPGRPPEDEPKIKAQRLTHLVVPFHVSQEEHAKRMMDSWVSYPPCRPGPADDEADMAGLPEDEKARLRQATPYLRRNLGPGHVPLGHQVALVLFVSCAPDRGLEDRLLGAYNLLPDAARQCFSSVRVRFASLQGKEDTYLSGSRHMFERMMNSQIGITEASYAFYMEPDCRPLRPYWLSVVDSLCRFPNGKFWIKGTIFRGSAASMRVRLLFNMFHINGNAIYNLGDQGFRDFYFKHVREWVTTKNAQGAYDTDVFKLLLDPDRYHQSKGWAHYFQFSDFIQNHWHANYSMAAVRAGSDLTVVVHGGTQHP